MLHQLLLPEKLKLHVGAELILAREIAAITFSSGVILSSSLFPADDFFGELLVQKVLIFLAFFIHIQFLIDGSVFSISMACSL